MPKTSDPRAGGNAGATAAEIGGAAGGGAGGAGPSLADICDGSDGPRLRLYTLIDVSRMVRYSVVQAENGYSQFMIDGHCRYWMHNRDPSLKVSATELEIRTGTLDAETEAMFNATFPLGSLSTELADCSPDGTIDKEPRVLADERGGVVCAGVGPRFDAAWNAVANKASALWEAGAPVDGPMRLSVAPATGMGTVYEWPLKTRLADIVLSQEQAFSTGVSTVIDGPADTALLRSLRATYLVDRVAKPGLFFDGMKVSDQGAFYYVYMRDTTPYEDARGLLPFTPPSSP